MKKFFKKFNDLTLTIILEAIVGVIAVGLSCIGLAFNQPGWAIGISSGTAVAMISTVLVFKGSDGAIRESKTGLYLFAYFLRMILFVGLMVLFALMQFKFNNPTFTNSLWGALIGYTPMFILLVVGQLKATHDMDKKIKKKDKEE